MSPASSREFPEFEQNTYSVTVVSDVGGTFQYCVKKPKKNPRVFRAISEQK